MKKANQSTQGRKRSTTRDLTARKGEATKGGIIAVLIGLLRPQPEPQTATQLNTRLR